MTRQEITPEIYTEHGLFEGSTSNINITHPINYKCFYLRVVFKHSEKLEKFLKDGDWEVVLRKR